MHIQEINTKSVISKSNLPVCDYSVNPYVGCTHACRYCYASFMKRFSHHTEPWGEFLTSNTGRRSGARKNIAGKNSFSAL